MFVAAEKLLKQQQPENCRKWERQESVGNFTLEGKTGFRQKGDTLNASVTVKCPGEDQPLMLVLHHRIRQSLKDQK